MHTYYLKPLSAAIIIITLPATNGCMAVNVKQIAYEVLRQEDCRINELEDFCSRNFAVEYHQYKNLRQNFLREQSQRTWRISRDAATLASNSATN